jgi:small-conductance mechanosensitive channel
MVPSFMIRVLVSILAVAFLLGGQAGAQTPPRPPAASEAEQARSALDVLKDDKKRAELIRVLEAIARAQPVPAQAAAPAKPADPPSVIPLAPDSLAAQLVAGASDRLGTISDDLVRIMHTATDFPLVWYWLQRVATDDATHALLLDVGWRLVVALGAALAVGRLTQRLLRRPLAALARRAPEWPPHEDPMEAAERGQTEKLSDRLPGLLALLRRLPFAIGGLLLDLMPTLVLLAVGYASLGTGLAPSAAPRYVILGALHAVALYGTVMALGRMMLAGRAASLTLFDVSPPVAASTLRWLSRTAGLAIYGTTILDIALLFGLYSLAHDTLLKLLALAVALMICAGLLRERAPVAAVIRGAPEADSFAATLRHRAADIWHVVACLYLLSLWLVWAIELPDGFARLLRLTVATVVVLGLARVASGVLFGSLRAAAPNGAIPDDGLVGRLGRYHPVARSVGKAAIAAITLLALFEAWGLPALSWFTADRLGGRLVGALANLAVTVVIALVVWESANMAVDRHLARLAAEHQAARSARLRTLLPMLRTTLLVAICMFTGLMVLSEIGVNIAPLLAGAGVVGLAIGFGSQKLVQDIITGLFLLLENTMQVGDSVTLGGLSGSVENLSIRTIRLRALDGSVHIVPFSAVTTVTNMTRDFGYAVIDVRVGLNEHPDRIGDILRSIADEMRDDPAWAMQITGALDVMGVDAFNVQSYTIRARIRTTPGGRWAVGREMNRRIKNAFDEQAIESPLTSYRALGQANPPPLEPPAG